MTTLTLDAASMNDADPTDAPATDLPHDDAAPPKRLSSLAKIIAITLFAIAAGTVYYFFGDQLSFTALAEKEQWLRETALENPVLAIGAAFLLYVAVTGLSLPGAAVMTLVIGWLFGFARGAVLVSFASTLGATLAFLFARFLLRDSIRDKFGDKLSTFEKNLEKDGPYYLFTLRLIPAVPFFVINLVMGLTPIKTRTYWWVSQLGMLPGTLAYVYAGSTIDLQRLAADGVAGLVSKELLIAFAILGLLPITIKKGLARLGPNDSSASSDESTIVSGNGEGT